MHTETSYMYTAEASKAQFKYTVYLGVRVQVEPEQIEIFQIRLKELKEDESFINIF